MKVTVSTLRKWGWNYRFEPRFPVEWWAKLITRETRACLAVYLTRRHAIKDIDGKFAVGYLEIRKR